MKKILKVFIFTMLLLLPFGVYAKDDVSISNISLKSSNGFAIPDGNPTVNGLTIGINGRFEQLGDYIVYEVTFENSSDKDYYFTDALLKEPTQGVITPGFSINSEYLKYAVGCDDTSADGYTIKAKQSKSCSLSISYMKEVPASKLTNGRFVDTSGISFAIQDSKEVKNTNNSNNNNKAATKAAKNPKTNNNFLILLIIGGIVIVGLAAIGISRKNKKVGKIVTVFAIALLPLSVWAISTLSIKVTGITIVPTSRFCYYDQYNDWNGLNATYHVYQKGMTLREYLSSDMNEEFIAHAVSDQGTEIEVFPSSHLAGGRRINSIGYPSHTICTENCGSYANGWIQDIDSEIIDNTQGCYTWMDIGSVAP